MNELRLRDGVPVITLVDSKGHNVQVGQPQGKAVLIYFMRSLDCPVCIGHVRRLIRKYATVKASADFVVVGAGMPENASRLEQSLKAPFRILADPTGEAYTAFGFGRALMGMIRQSGLVVVDANGKLMHAHRTGNPMSSYDEQAVLIAANPDPRL